MKNVLVILNYEAGRKKAVMLKKAVIKELLKRGLKFKFIEVQEAETVDISAYDTLLAIGGDGTVNKAAVKILENSSEDKTLGIIPAGTANLLAAKLGLGRNKIFKIIDNNCVKKIDIMQINGRYSVLRCGFGYDADIICKTPQSLKNRYGYASYFIAGIIFAFRLKHKNFEAEFDGNKLKFEASEIIAANAANMLGNAVSTADNSFLDDGLIDIFILKTKNPAAFIYEVLRIICGIRKNSSRALYLKAKSVKIKTARCLCHIDGEKIKSEGDIDIKISDKKLSVFCCR